MNDKHHTVLDKKNKINFPTSTTQLLRSYDILREFRKKIESKIYKKSKN